MKRHLKKQRLIVSSKNSLCFLLGIGMYLFVQVTYAAGAKRIVALSPHSVELLYAIGAGDRIVATVEYADYPEQAKSILRVGNYAGIKIEKILALKPDLIVAWRSGNRATDLKKIESLGFKIHYTQPKSISQISDDLRLLGELTGLEEKAAEVINTLSRRYEAIKQQYRSKPNIPVYYQLWHEPMRSVGPGSWIEKMIADCGGENIFNDSNSDYPLVSIESVLVKKPKVIIIPHHSGGDKRPTDIWSRWSEIPAVKNKHIFTLNGDILHRFTPRALDGLEQLCKVIDQAR
jgi:vitamin B12 transport system substrate-binding protein